MADRSAPPDTVPLDPGPNHLARSALFLFAYEVSCRVRAERAMPYAPLERFTPGPCGPMWVPRPPAPPGGSALWHSVVTQLYTPRTVRCQHSRPADYSKQCLEVEAFSEVRIRGTERDRGTAAFGPGRSVPTRSRPATARCGKAPCHRGPLPALYELTTPRSSASLPRWGRSRRSRWHLSNG